MSNIGFNINEFYFEVLIPIDYIGMIKWVIEQELQQIGDFTTIVFQTHVIDITNMVKESLVDNDTIKFKLQIEQSTKFLTIKPESEQTKTAQDLFTKLMLTEMPENISQYACRLLSMSEEE